MATQEHTEHGPDDEEGQGAGATEGAEGAVEVRGRTVLQVVEGIPDAAEDTARETLAEMGIEDPDPDAWYPQSAWVATIEAIGDRIGRATVQEIARTVVGNVEWPDGTEGFRDGIEVVERAYQDTHRGADVSGYEWDAREETTVVRCDTDHPPAFDEAIVKATARSFPNEGISKVADVSDRFEAEPGSVFEVSWWSMGA